MFNRNDLTLSLFYASSTNDEGEKVATLTVQVNNSDMVAMQSNKLQCITDKAGKKVYSVGEQMSPMALIRCWLLWRTTGARTLRRL